MTGFKGRCPAVERARNVGPGGGIRTLKLLGLNEAHVPRFCYTGLVEREGFELSVFTAWVSRLQRGAVATVPPLHLSGPAPGIRTRSVQALDLTSLPVGLAPDGPPRRSRTDCSPTLRIYLRREGRM